MPTYQTNVKKDRKFRKKFKKQKMTKKDVYKIAKKVMISEAEKHYYDYNNSISPSASGSIIALSAITQGILDNQRIGDEVTISSISFRGQLYYGDDTNVIRIILFQWLVDDNVELPTVSNIIQSDIIGFVGAPSGHYSKDYAGYKWVPLADKTFVTTGVTTSPAGGCQLVNFKITNKDLQKGKKTARLSFVAGGTKGIGMIYMCIISDSTATYHPTMYYDSRIRFLTD